MGLKTGETPFTAVRVVWQLAFGAFAVWLVLRVFDRIEWIAATLREAVGMLTF